MWKIIPASKYTLQILIRNTVTAVLLNTYIEVTEGQLPWLCLQALVCDFSPSLWQSGHRTLRPASTPSSSAAFRQFQVEHYYCPAAFKTSPLSNKLCLLHTLYCQLKLHVSGGKYTDVVSATASMILENCTAKVTCCYLFTLTVNNKVHFLTWLFCSQTNFHGLVTTTSLFTITTIILNLSFNPKQFTPMGIELENLPYFYYLYVLG